MRALVLWCVGLALAIIGADAAQGKPDFSGRWVAQSPSPSWAVGKEWTIRQDASTLKMEWVSQRGGGLVSATYKLDGSQGHNNFEGMELVSRASWSGNSLVLANRMTNALTDAPVELRTTLSLNDNGTLTIESHVPDGNAPTSKLVLRRQSPAR